MQTLYLSLCDCNVQIAFQEKTSSIGFHNDPSPLSAFVYGIRKILQVVTSLGLENY